MILIGLSGKIGVGKSALARELCSRVENGVRLSFATALKQEAVQKYGYDPLLNETSAGKNEVVFHPELPGGFAQVREILIGLGQSRRSGDPEYWCKRLASALDALELAGIRMVVVDDIRFANEVATLRLRDAFLVRVEAYEGWFSDKFSTDSSETALDNFVGWDMVVRQAFGPDGIRNAANEILYRMLAADDVMLAG